MSIARVIPIVVLAFVSLTFADMTSFKNAEKAIAQAINEENIPGAVLLAGNRDGVVYIKSIGDRAVEPTHEAMTDDTIFDLASLSKPIGCATSVMILVDRGKIQLTDPVMKHIPEFGNNGKEAITVEQLLLHTGGLIPDNPMSDYTDGVETAWKKLHELTPKWEPGTRVKYSDVGFIILGKLVETVDGRPLSQFAQEEVFKPLGMKDTTYLPAAERKPRIAPTEKRSKDDADFIRGEVHDPRAHALGGFAGHAGLFGTADDVSRWVRMLLNGGQLDGTRILSKSTVKNMLTQRCLEADGETNCRGLGVDIDSGYSPAPRGGHFPVGTSFGHTGFTGTSFWADPETGVFYVLLTSRLHPDGKGEVKELRRAVSTDVAEGLMDKVRS